MFNPHNPQTADLPFSNAPINWLEPLAFKFHQLRDVSTAAERAGFRIFRLKVVPGGYEALCQRKPDAGKPFREPSKPAPEARQSCTPDSPYTQPEN
jgi:hypothetical protein